MLSILTLRSQTKIQPSVTTFKNLIIVWPVYQCSPRCFFIQFFIERKLRTLSDSRMSWTLRGASQISVNDTARSLTQRCQWHPVELDSAVSMTPRGAWLSGVNDTTRSFTNQCQGRAELDSAVSMTPHGASQISVNDTARSLTQRCHWHCAELDSAVSMTPRGSWLSSVNDTVEWFLKIILKITLNLKNLAAPHKNG